MYQVKFYILSGARLNPATLSPLAIVFAKSTALGPSPCRQILSASRGTPTPLSEITSKFYNLKENTVGKNLAIYLKSKETKNSIKLAKFFCGERIGM